MTAGSPLSQMKLKTKTAFSDCRNHFIVQGTLEWVLSEHIRNYSDVCVRWLVELSSQRRQTAVFKNPTAVRTRRHKIWTRTQKEIIIVLSFHLFWDLVAFSMRFMVHFHIILTLTACGNSNRFGCMTCRRWIFCWQNKIDSQNANKKCTLRDSGREGTNLVHRGILQ